MTDKKLEILVVEDTPIHQEAARRLLSEHNVQIVSTFDEATDLLRIPLKWEGSIVQPVYDAVLTDMFLTQGQGRCLSPDMKHLAKEQMPFGYPIALMACQKGVPYVAIVSDADHHSGPMAYSIDFFAKEYIDRKTIQQVGNSRLAVFNRRIKNWTYLGRDGKIVLEDPLRPSSQKIGEGATLVKNWAEALDYVRNEAIHVPQRFAQTELNLKN